MGEQSPALVRLLDTALRRPAALPDLLAVERTRLFNQVRVARWIGEMAVTAGRKEVGKRLTALRSPPVAERPAPARPTQPFDGYDGLAATDVVALLARLPRADLELIRDYETANRNRRTILNRIDGMTG